jgi:hypothetical protein
MKTHSAMVLFVIALSVPGLETWQPPQTGGGATAPNPAANPPRLPLEQRIAHSDPSRYRASSGV